MTQSYAEPGRFTSGLLAVVVHVLFIAMLVFGIRWQQRLPEPLVAELWQEIPPPKAQPVVRPPEPPPPLPTPKPQTPPPEPPKPVVQQKPVPAPVAPPKADIDLKEKQRKLKEEKAAAEAQRQAELQQKEEARKQAEAQRREEQLRQEELKKQEEARRKEEEKRREEAQRAEELRMEKDAEARRVAILDEQQKLAQEVKARAEAEARKRAAAEAAAAQLKALEGYKRKISQKIRGYIVLPPGISGNPEAAYSVTVVPGGEVLDVKLVKSSGVPAYDAAVERAIQAASPLPVPTDPDMFQQLRQMNFRFRPNE
jgi:colicin import membrane protein